MDFNELAERVSKLETWKNGNGALGSEKRLQALEQQEDNMSCRTGQRLEKHIQYHREMEDKNVDAERWQKEMKATRRNNAIGFASLAVTILLAILFGA